MGGHREGTLSLGAWLLVSGHPPPPSFLLQLLTPERGVCLHFQTPAPVPVPLAPVRRISPAFHLRRSPSECFKWKDSLSSTHIVHCSG